MIDNTEQNSYPGVLWLLPILFGIVGGTIAALIASMKYQAKWSSLFIVGLVITLIGIPIIIGMTSCLNNLY